MRNILLTFLMVLIMLSVAYPAPTDTTIDLSWEGPTTNADGTPINDLDDYVIYYGHKSGEYFTNIKDIKPTHYIVDNLKPNTNYCFIVTAVDTSGNESVVSNEVCGITAKDNVAPAACRNLKIQ